MVAQVQSKGTNLPMAFGRSKSNLFPTALIMPTYQFDGVPTPISVDLETEITTSAIDLIMVAFLDNSQNNGTLTLQFLGYAPIKIGPNSQGYLPVVTPPIPNFTLFHTLANAVVNVQFMNRPMPANVWKTV